MIIPILLATCSGGGFVQRFLSKANSDGIALELSNTALQFGPADYSLVIPPFCLKQLRIKQRWSIKLVKNLSTPVELRAE